MFIFIITYALLIIKSAQGQMLGAITPDIFTIRDKIGRVPAPYRQGMLKETCHVGLLV